MSHHPIYLQNRYFLTVTLLVTLFAGCKKSDDHPSNTYYHDYTFEEPSVTGNTFYIDPIHGSAAGDGSSSHPWSTLQAVIDSGLIEFYAVSDEPEMIHEGAPVRGGDRLLLRTGYHGFINLSQFVFNDWLTIAAEEGNIPVFSQIKMEGAFKNIYLKNLTIIKDSYIGDENYWEADDVTRNSDACLYLGSNDFWGKGSSVKVNGLTLMTTQNISGWTAADWVEKAASGISLRSAEHIEVVNCTIENVKFGISVEYNSDYSSVVNNTVKYYSGDGSRIISNNILFAYNTITGCLKVDDNHDDGIQSYTRGEEGAPGEGVLHNVTIRGNLIIGIADENNPLSGSPQGIGCFDGLFDNWIVENNVIISNTYHGISFYGMIEGRIINNTVIDQVPDDDVCPWIMVTDHKNGASSRNCIVANNIVSSSVSVSGLNVVEYSNYVFGRDNYDAVYNTFVNPDENNLHLLINDFTLNNLIDKGTIFNDLVSSEADLEGSSRTGSPDLGAFEAEE
jgi:parallel beta-helix repeat protein